AGLLNVRTARICTPAYNIELHRSRRYQASSQISQVRYLIQVRRSPAQEYVSLTPGHCAEQTSLGIAVCGLGYVRILIRQAAVPWAAADGRRPQALGVVLAAGIPEIRDYR